MAKDEDSYGGYGEPPAPFRFRPGESGNPFGRPYGSHSMNVAIDQILRRRISVTERGVRRKLPIGEIVIKRLIKDALDGNIRAIAEVLQIWLINQPDEDSMAGVVKLYDPQEYVPGSDQG